jgi:hypothetical protein
MYLYKRRIIDMQGNKEFSEYLRHSFSVARADFAPEGAY